MLRRFVRWVLLLVLAGSLASTILTAARISSDPTISPYAAATPAETVNTAQRLLATHGTSAAVVAQLRKRLNEQPRNWLSLSRLVGFAQSRAIVLAPDVADALAIAKEDDAGFYAFSSSCTTCAADPGLCPFAQVLICQTPLALPPAADIQTLPAFVTAAQGGLPSDQAALAVTLTDLLAEQLATAANDARAIRNGAQLAMLGNRMRLLSPALTTMASEAALDGVNWAAPSRMGTAADISAVARTDAFAPLSQVLSNLAALQSASTSKTVLHLLPSIDSAADAQGLARAAAALGPQFVVTFELLGKQGTIHTTQQVSKTGWTLVAGLTAFWLAFALLLGSWLQNRMEQRRHPPEIDAD